MPSPTIAANAYAALSKISAGAGNQLPTPGGDKGGASFSNFLKDALGGVAELGRKSDAQAQSVAAGKSNMIDVVTAVAETEVAVGALVSVRDRVIQSYEEIMRMPI